MKTLTVLAGSIVAMIALAAPMVASSAIPNETSTRTNLQIIKELRAASALAERNSMSWSQEPLTQAEFDAQELSLERLIKRLQDGDPVSPAEVNRALAGPDTPY